MMHMPKKDLFNSATVESMIPAIIMNITQATPTIRTLRIEPKGDFAFKAGQWVDFYADIAGVRRVAGYSMTSSPLVLGYFDLAVKRIGENPVTKYIHSEAKEGEVVHVDGGNGRDILRSRRREERDPAC